MITDRELRFECLKMAIALDLAADPRLIAQGLVEYVQSGIRTEHRHRQPDREDS